MNNLPAEILHLICRHLPRQYVASFRMVSRAFAQVAAYYLVDRVYFHTSYASLERLKFFADHPVFHQTVKEITYEAYTIREIGDQDQYFHHFEFDRHLAKDRPKPLSASFTQREERLFKRNQIKFRNKVDANYRTYRGLFDEQQKLLTHDALQEFIGKNVLKFRNLEIITFIPVRQCVHVASARSVNEYGYDFAVPMSPTPKFTSFQVESLLIPSGLFSNKLRCVTLDLVDPSFFGNKANRRSIMDAFKPLKQVHITLKSDASGATSSTDTCIENLSQGILRDALAGAKDLTDLTLSTNSPHIEFMDNKFFVADNVWLNLRLLGLEAISTTQAQLVTMLKNHPVLKTLNLSIVELRGGNWPDTILEMHRDLDLTDFTCRGFLKDSDNIWDVNLLEELAYRDGIHFTLADALQDYVCAKSYYSSSADFHVCEECGDGHGHPLLSDYDSFMPHDLLEEVLGSLSDEDEFYDMEFAFGNRYAIDLGSL